MTADFRFLCDSCVTLAVLLFTRKQETRPI